VPFVLVRVVRVVREKRVSKMKTSYQYSLDRSSKKYLCSECERKTFVLYIDNNTGNPLNLEVGKCDRANNCGHHYPPKQYFSDNDISLDKKEFRPLPKPKPKPSYIDKSFFEKTLQGYEKNNLVQFLKKRFEVVEVDEVVNRYRIGTVQSGATVFWQIDQTEAVRSGKVIEYQADGHRRKDVFPQVQWVHTVLKLPNFALSQCLFGEHLLTDTTKTVALVESEKTALIASIRFPKFIWLAVGGSEGLNVDKLRILQGRNVILCPDVGMLEKWKKKADELKTFCKVSVFDLLEHNATDDERQAGLDLADYLLKVPTKTTEPQPTEYTLPIHEDYEFMGMFDEQ